MVGLLINTIQGLLDVWAIWAIGSNYPAVTSLILIGLPAAGSIILGRMGIVTKASNRREIVELAIRVLVFGAASISVATGPRPAVVPYAFEFPLMITAAMNLSFLGYYVFGFLTTLSAKIAGINGNGGGG